MEKFGRWKSRLDQDDRSGSGTVVLKRAEEALCLSAVSDFAGRAEYFCSHLRFSLSKRAIRDLQEMSLFRSFWLSFAITITTNVFICVARDLECKDIISKSSQLALKNYLFCDYDNTVRPSVNATEISFAMLPKFIEFDEYRSSFTVHAWTLFTWTDVHLSWDPKAFNNTRMIHITTEEIWVPDVSVHNSGDLGMDQQIPFTKCMIHRRGGVMCLASDAYHVRCDGDYTMWPYDVQNCSIRLSSWSHKKAEITFRMLHTGVMLDNYRPSWEWNLISANAVAHEQPFKYKPEENAPMISIHFLFERLPNTIHAIFIVPILVLVVLTLTTLWLDVNSIERCILANVNLICHLLQIQDLYWNIPYNGSATPKILIFYEHSLLIAGFVLILTMLLREVQEFNFAPPKIITTTTSVILKSKVGQILLLSILDPKASAGFEAEADDNLNLVNSDTRSQVWGHFTILIGWIAFIAAFIIYTIMLFVYLPQRVY